MRFILVPVIRLLSWIDYGYRALIRQVIPFAYVRKGRCKQCGECCKNILITMEPKYLKMSFFRNLAIGWNEYFNDLILIGSLIDDGYIIFTCKHLLPTGACGNYNWKRPVFCYEYPRIFKYFEVPTTLPDCGYHYALRKTGKTKKTDL
jgi:hypothetical protein